MATREKVAQSRLEEAQKEPDSTVLSRRDDDIDKKAERRLVLKLDLAILPMTVLMVSHPCIQS